MDRDSGAFGPSLRSLRLQAGLSQKQLADFSTLSVRAIRDLENGRVKSPRRDTIQLLGKALNLDAVQQDCLRALGSMGAPSVSIVPPLGPDPVRPPVATGPLIGRDHELDTLMNLFGAEHRRLITITGLAGVGKTRLALEFARALHVQEGSSVLWVPLAEESRRWNKQSADTALLSARIRDLILAERNDVKSIRELIGHGSTLIALDGKEDTFALTDVIAQLLAEFPRLRILITARNSTGVTAESLFPLAPLPLPEADPDMDPSKADRVASVKMFLMHMKQVRPDFELSTGNVAAISRICRALDGLPAALELGARWSLMYSPQQMADLLVNDPMMVATPLDGEKRDVLGMFASIRSIITSLTQRQRRLLSVMAQRPGYWSITDVAASTGMEVADFADDMYTLLMHGLLRRRDETGQSRFEALNIVRSLRGDDERGFS
ncbi:helix-turn-helix domain-containing protein [Streptomyces sp. 8N616]|uniref:helix-turn-helix domain-containing protein n=1 Tax=Streptomyces sp. 8N616 TaxID=3457414 RepID=UPI003FD2E37E